MQDSFGYWLSGFVDGEACFHLKVLSRKGHKGQAVESNCKLKCSCAFSIGLRADDLPILKKIRTYLGCGSIRPYKTSSTNKFSSNPKFYYTVEAIKDHLRVVQHFDAYPLRSKKARDYKVYRQAVLLLVEINSRKRGWLAKGDGRGRSQRWTVADERKFVRLKNRLEKGRKFRA